MRVFLTGADGYIGRALALRLAARGDVELVPSDRQPPPGFSGVRLDLVDTTALRRELARCAPDVVVHAAGRKVGLPSQMLRDNAVATANLGEAIAAAAPAARLVVLCSAAQYGPSLDYHPWRESDQCRPRDPYAISKHAGEQCVMLQRGHDVTALRLFNVVAAEPGGGQAFASFLARAAEAAAGPAPKRIRMGPLEAVRDFIDIEDVVRAVEAVIDREVWGEVINVASGQGRLVRTLIETALGMIDGGLSLDAPTGQLDDLPWSVGDPGKAERLLGFRPTGDLTPLLGRAASWVRSGGKAGTDARSHV